MNCCDLSQISIPQSFCRCSVIQCPVGIHSDRRNEEVKGKEVQLGELEGAVWRARTYLHGVIESLSEVGRHTSDAFHCKRQRMLLPVVIQSRTILHCQDRVCDAEEFPPAWTIKYTAVS